MSEVDVGMMGMDLWVTEEHPDRSIRSGYAVDAVLFRGQSDFQNVAVVETKAFGRMLLLDGLIMLTDRDEFVYHEMISHIPACLHRSPKKVVVIGGGDGGTVRELLKHPEIEEVTLCEIDRMVIDVSKEFFPAVAGRLSDPRVKVRIGDGLAYMRDLSAQSVDMVVVDSTDPIGPGEGLFSKDFYRSVAKSLRQGGLMVAQSESPWHPREVLQRISSNISAGFPNLRSYIGLVPTYPFGAWSWTMASQQAIHPDTYDRQRFARIAPTLKYLNSDLMTGAFALPTFYAEKLGR